MDARSYRNMTIQREFLQLNSCKISWTMSELLKFHRYSKQLRDCNFNNLDKGCLNKVWIIFKLLTNIFCFHIFHLVSKEFWYIWNELFNKVMLQFMLLPSMNYIIWNFPQIGCILNNITCCSTQNFGETTPKISQKASPSMNKECCLTFFEKKIEKDRRHDWSV